MRPSLRLLALASLLLACSDDIELARDGSTGGTAGSAGTAGTGGAPVGCVSGSAVVDSPCATEGEECGHCSTPSGPLYRCDSQVWAAVKAGFCEDSMPSAGQGGGGQGGSAGQTSAPISCDPGAACFSCSQWHDGGDVTPACAVPCELTPHCEPLNLTGGAAPDAAVVSCVMGVLRDGMSAKVSWYDLGFSETTLYVLAGRKAVLRNTAGDLGFSEKASGPHTLKPSSYFEACAQKTTQDEVRDCLNNAVEVCGTGGSGGSGGSAVCDPSTYTVGKACTGTERCVDGTTVWYCKNGTEGGSIVADTRISDGPLPAGCAPQGDWSITRAAPTSGGTFNGCNPAGPATPEGVRLTVDVDGGLLGSLGGTFDLAACRLDVQNQTSFSNPSETWTESWKLSISFASSGASGDYKRTVGGFCQGGDAGPLIVTKK